MQTAGQLLCQLMFGSVGYLLMALSSVAATLGSLTVAFAAMPRIIYSLARDGHFFGPLAPWFGSLHPRWGTPVPKAGTSRRSSSALWTSSPRFLP